MQTAYQIFEYLPLKYKNPTDAEYFEFLVNSVEQNYEAENYHFALVALHMIYMGIVYHYIYGIYRADKNRFEYVLIGFHDSLKKGRVKDFSELSWHIFSVINESTIFQFFRAVGFPVNDIGNLKAPVSKRNDILHTNGIFIQTEKEFETQSKQYLKNLEKIHTHCIQEYKSLFFQFLNDQKFGMNTVDEAIQYLEENFIKEFGINIKILEDIHYSIPKSQYPQNKKRFFQAIEKIIM